MRLLTPISILALVATVLADAAPSDVISLTNADFDSVVNSEALILVEFFAPWCGHCKALAPQYEEAATSLKEKNIKLAKVDCVEEPDLCQAHDVAGYPTLKVFRHGVPTEYNGPRKADGIVHYMIKQSLPAVTPVTAIDHDDFIKADKIVVVAYLNSPTDEPFAEFSSTAQKHRDDYLFGLTSDPAAISAARVTPPAIVIYRAFDEPRIEYPYPVISTKVEDLEEWIKDLSIPIIDEVSGENYAVYAQSQKPLAYLFVNPEEERKQDYIEMVRPTATRFKNKVNFVWIDAARFGDHAKALNLQQVKWPSFVIQELTTQLKYPYDQDRDISEAAIADHVMRYLDGKLDPQLKSQPIPETQDEPVRVVVGKNFEEVVFDDSKDVFIEFYATWCGHCKRLAPVWDQLATRFANVQNLIIAKMDAPENDLPPSVPFRIGGFPTLKFKPAGSRDFIEYEGDRSLENLVEFVQANAKTSLEPVLETEPEGQTPLVREPVEHVEL